MERQEGGYFYDLRGRIRGHLARQKWTLGREWSPVQEDVWLLLNEVEGMVKLLEDVERGLDPDDRREWAYKIRHTVWQHFRASPSREKPCAAELLKRE